MLLESAVLCVVALACGLGLLVAGLRSWVRTSLLTQSTYATSVWLGVFMLARTIQGVGGELVSGLGGVSDAFALTAVGGSLFLEWRLSTLLACLVPSFVFGLLLLTKPSAMTTRGLVALLLLLGAGLTFIVTNQLLWWLVSFELLLLVSLYLLRLTSKSERIGDAVAEMFF